MQQARAVVTLGGTRVDVCTRAEVVAGVRSRLTDRAARPLFLASANLDHLTHFGLTGTSGTDVDFDDAAVQWLVLLDGVPLVWRTRRMVPGAVEQLAGSDLLPDLLQVAADAGCRVGVLGGTASTHRLLAEAASVRWPHLRLARCWDPTREELADPSRCRDLAHEIEAAEIDLLVVALGKPRQERFLAEHGLASGVRVAVAFGAAIDFLAGTAARAPVAVRRAGLEWLWRLGREPRRLAHRYLVEGPGAVVALWRDSRVHPAPVPPLARPYVPLQRTSDGDASAPLSSTAVGVRPDTQQEPLRAVRTDRPS